jgi:hypothetical protein
MVTPSKRHVVRQICQLRGSDPESEESQQMIEQYTFAQLYTILKEEREAGPEMVPILKKLSAFKE